MKVDINSKDKLPKEILELGITTDENGIIDIPLYFKFTKEFASILTDFLNTKPSVEVEEFVKQVEACTNDPELYLDYDGLMNIVTYLKAKCPRKEVIHILDRFMSDKGDVLVFSIKSQENQTNKS